LNTDIIKRFIKNSLVEIAWQVIYKRANIYNYIPVLCYHRILPEFIEDNSQPIYTVSPEQFESQMAFLADNGFTSLSLDEYALMAKGLHPITERCVLINFDDSYADNYEIAWHIAQRYNIKMNLFICTDYIGQSTPIIMLQDGYISANSDFIRKNETYIKYHITKFPHLWRPLNWLELREMQNSGVQIGSHSHSHRNLALLTSDEIIADIKTSLTLIARELDYQTKYFAIPYGAYEHYTPEVISILNSFSFDLIFSTHLGRARLPSNGLPFPRILIHQQDNLMVFQRKLFGAYDLVAPITDFTKSFLPKWN
jgi:peptidoglycan/xylan/chitin deacetylase (PgdA/CDA1 family)